MSHYEDCHDGPFHPMRHHESPFGWAVVHRKTDKIFAFVGDKSACFGVSAALNGKWEAAEVFMNHVSSIRDDYFNQFPEARS